MNYAKEREIHTAFHYNWCTPRPNSSIMLAPYIHQVCTAPLPILYADESIVFVNKPSGLLSVPGRDPAHYDSAYSRVLERYGEAHVVHRLDMDTSGVMVLARNKDALRHLSRQFQQRSTSKTYMAWVDGLLVADEGEVDLPLRCDWPNRPLQIVDHELGKSSLTKYRVVRRDSLRNASLVALTPITGRTHQLRVHMAELGHAILGCRFYGSAKVQEKASRLQLHAYELRVFHPRTDLPIRQSAVAPFAL